MIEGIAISALPDEATLEQWVSDRVTKWVSLCGVSVHDITKNERLRSFEGDVFRLGDPFSDSQSLSLEFRPSARYFLDNSNPMLRSILTQAVRKVSENCQEGQNQVVFCHLGKSRSPLVSTAAIAICTQSEPEAVWLELTRDYGADPATRLGMSAAYWLIENYK